MLFRRLPGYLRAALSNKVGFAAMMGVSFFGLLIYGVPPQAPPVDHGTGLGPLPGGALPLRLDTAIPQCDSAEAMNGVTGALVRAKQVRINGLTDVEQIAGDAEGNRSCRAMVNLDFGSQAVEYGIRLLTPGRKTWELAVTGP